MKLTVKWVRGTTKIGRVEKHWSRRYTHHAKASEYEKRVKLKKSAIQGRNLFEVGEDSRPRACI